MYLIYSLITLIYILFKIFASVFINVIGPYFIFLIWFDYCFVVIVIASVYVKEQYFFLWSQGYLASHLGFRSFVEFNII